MTIPKNTLEKVRFFLDEKKIDAIFIPKHDRFFGEHIQERDDILHYVSNFTGSFGFCVITKTTANLWVDGRYTVQAALETDPKEWTIYRYGEDDLQSFIEKNQIKSLAFDSWLVSISQFKRWQNDLKNNHFIELEPDWIDAIWQDRPLQKPSELFNHDLQFSGMNTKDKIDAISEHIQKPYLIHKPENFCWLLNIRGHDVPYTPLAQGCIIWNTDNSLDVFVNDAQSILTKREDLNDVITIHALNDLPEKINSFKSLYIHEESTPYALSKITSLLPSKEYIDPLKARKNSVEQKGMKEAHIKDAIAVIKTLYWLDNLKSKESLTELDVSKFLLGQRKEYLNFLYPSFETISASGPNAAIVHYHPTEKNNRSLNTDRILLLDSGGQYLEGTTDITRTIAIAQPTDEEKIHYTKVLKGNIALASIRFPKGTTGAQLDVLARQYLWRDGLTYNHGTGHGVGCCLNVHEGPQSISSRSMIPLDVGMILSNEPGFYKQNYFGIRIENLEIVKESCFEGFFEFETITLVPYDKRLIIKDMLTNDEVKWINTYYEKIKINVMPFLEKNHQNWLTSFINF